MEDQRRPDVISAEIGTDAMDALFSNYGAKKRLRKARAKQRLRASPSV
jgi:hypothetical protein